MIIHMDLLVVKIIEFIFYITNPNLLCILPILNYKISITYNHNQRNCIVILIFH